MPDPEKISAFRNFPQPTDVTSLRSFVGLANQLGHLIPDLAHLTKPLYQLLKEDVSLRGLGYALIQRGEGGKIHLIRCCYHSLSPAQKNYATIELEVLAIY